MDFSVLERRWEVLRVSVLSNLSALQRHTASFKESTSASTHRGGANPHFTLQRREDIRSELLEALPKGEGFDVIDGHSHEARSSYFKSEAAFAGIQENLAAASDVVRDMKAWVAKVETGREEPRTAANELDKHDVNVLRREGEGHEQKKSRKKVANKEASGGAMMPNRVTPARELKKLRTRCEAYQSELGVWSTLLGSTSLNYDDFIAILPSIELAIELSIFV